MVDITSNILKDIFSKRLTKAKDGIAKSLRDKSFKAIEDYKISFKFELPNAETSTTPETTKEGSVSIGATTKKGTKFSLSHSRTEAEENTFYPERKTQSTILSISKSFKKGGKVKEAYNGSFIEGGPGSNATYRKYYKGMV